MRVCVRARVSEKECAVGGLKDARRRDVNSCQGSSLRLR